MSSLHRFSQIVAEELKLENTCPDCGGVMIESEFPRSMNMQFCVECNKFRPIGNTNGNTASNKDTEL